MSPRNTKPFTLDRIVRIIIGILILVAAGLLMNRLSDVLLPFLIAWLLAYLMYPLVGFFQYKLHFRFRIPSIIATLTTVFGVLSTAFYFLIPPIIEQSQRAGVLIGAFLKNPQQGWTLPPQVTETIQDFLKTIDIQSHLNFDNFEGFVKSVLPRLWDVVSGASSIILNIFVVFVVLLYLIFILKDYEKITEGWIE